MPSPPTSLLDRAGHPVTVEELRARVIMVEPGIILLREWPHSNAQIYQTMTRVAEELASQEPHVVMILDLTEAKARPDPAMMKAIVESSRRLGLYTAAVRPSSRAIKAVLKFVTGRASGIEGYSLHDDVNEALDACRAKLQELRASSEISVEP